MCFSFSVFCGATKMVLWRVNYINKIRKSKITTCGRHNLHCPSYQLIVCTMMVMHASQFPNKLCFFLLYLPFIPKLRDTKSIVPSPIPPPTLNRIIANRAPQLCTNPFCCYRKIGLQAQHQKEIDLFIGPLYYCVFSQKITIFIF